MSTNILKEYKKLYKKYKQEHGDKTVLLMQIGKFYEIYTIDEKNLKVGNAEEIANILEIKLTKKDSNKEYNESNPYFTGFPISSSLKYINKLIKNEYIVVVYDQEESNDKTNIKRYLKGIYTNTITPLDSDFENEDNYLFIGVITQLYRKDLYNYGYTLFNNRTNEVYVNELNNVNMKEINQEKYNLLSIFNVKQKIEKISKDVEKKYFDKEYCYSLIKEVYKNISFGLLNPLQFFFNKTVNIELIQSFCLFLDLINRYNPTLLINISKPNLYHQNDNKLYLHLNTINQLHLNSLKDYIINCVTSVGRRKAISLLYEPYSDKNSIIESTMLSHQIENKYKELKNLLKNLKDIVKIHRELSTYSIKIHDIYQKIVDNYIVIENIIEILDEDFLSFKNINKSEFKKIIRQATDDIIDNINGESFIDKSHWKTDEIKSLESDKKLLIEEFEIEKNKYNKYDKDKYLKLEIGGIGTTEYYYKITSSRFNQNSELKKVIERDGLIIVNQKTNLKIISTKLNEKWAKIEMLNNEIVFKTKEIFKNYLEYFINKYSHIFDIIKIFIENIDIAVMNNINKNLYNYNPIKFIEEDRLYIKELRHPIIERINDNVDYIANDITFTRDNKGIVLYGINSSGKSSLIRALGISIIMAQCGFYVPCSNFEMLEPYKNLMCQVDLQDDIFNGNSSYVTEAIGIKYMLNILEKNEKSMIIADELTRGTENKSAIAIFGATVKRMLSQKNCNFIFTTHLHEISQLNALKKDINTGLLKIYHIKVDRDNNTGEFIFRRKLEQGTIDPLYGLEIVKSIIGDKIFDPFIIEAESIRKEICGEKDELITFNKSKYNRKKIVNKCEICGYKNVKPTDLPLDVHHIRFQCNTNEKGFINEAEYIHKNNKSNLVVLCKQCHVKVHKNEISIEGYVQTSENIKIFFKSNI